MTSPSKICGNGDCQDDPGERDQYRERQHSRSELFVLVVAFFQGQPQSNPRSMKAPDLWESSAFSDSVHPDAIGADGLFNDRVALEAGQAKSLPVHSPFSPPVVPATNSARLPWSGSDRTFRRRSLRLPFHTLTPSPKPPSNPGTDGIV